MSETYTPELIQLRSEQPPHNTLEGPAEMFEPLSEWLSQGWLVNHEYLDGEDADGAHVCFHRTGEINGIPYICGQAAAKHIDYEQPPEGEAR